MWAGASVTGGSAPRPGDLWSCWIVKCTTGSIRFLWVHVTKQLRTEQGIAEVRLSAIKRMSKLVKAQEYCWAGH